uniref:Uncharacterized protein n=1 Tax=Arundo donax TaxID=35708 RepID=A0A0A9CVL8_ARUDO
MTSPPASLPRGPWTAPEARGPPSSPEVADGGGSEGGGAEVTWRAAGKVEVNQIWLDWRKIPTRGRCWRRSIVRIQRRRRRRSHRTVWRRGWRRPRRSAPTTISRQDPHRANPAERKEGCSESRAWGASMWPWRPPCVTRVGGGPWPPSPAEGPTPRPAGAPKPGAHEPVRCAPCRESGRCPQLAGEVVAVPWLRSDPAARGSSAAPSAADGGGTSDGEVEATWAAAGEAEMARIWPLPA